jgi:hypothetical protein
MYAQKYLTMIRFNHLELWVGPPLVAQHQDPLDSAGGDPLSVFHSTVVASSEASNAMIAVIDAACWSR